jgi:hypothetical protein
MSLTSQMLLDAFSSIELQGHSPEGLMISSRTYQDLRRWGQGNFQVNVNSAAEDRVFGIPITVARGISDDRFVLLSEGSPYSFPIDDEDDETARAIGAIGTTGVTGTIGAWERNVISSATQSEILRTGLFGHLYSADIHVSSAMPAPIVDGGKRREYCIHDVDYGCRWDFL